jgi:hypothetical protein
MSEGMRIAQLAKRTRVQVAAAVATAAAVGQKRCCDGPEVQSRAVSEGEALNGVLKNCDFYMSPYPTTVASSTNLQQLEARTIIASRDPTDPLTRFSAYVRFFPEPCPPIPSFYATAGEPKIQDKGCGLPNLPGNISLPAYGVKPGI